jgi:hypothetical protein
MRDWGCFLIIVALVGGIVMFAALPKQPYNAPAPTGPVMCDEERMSPGDMCVEYINGKEVGRQTYDGMRKRMDRSTPGQPFRVPLFVVGAVMAAGATGAIVFFRFVRLK